MSFKTACLGLTLALVTGATLSLAGQKKIAPGVLVPDKGKFDIKLAGQTVGHEEFEIAPAEGGWLAKGSSDIKPPEGAPSKVTGSLTLLDNNLYYQYAVLARIYDWSKGGEQTFPVLIPQELTPGTVTVLSTGAAAADGKTYEGLKVTSSDLEILLLLDNNHRLVRLEVPAAKVSVIRE